MLEKCVTCGASSTALVGGYCCGKCAKATSAGVKHDLGKLRLDLLPVRSLEAVVRVMMHGVNKYGGDDNWRNVPDGRRRYYAAALRHIFSWWVGEKADKETGESHLAHLICCAMFLMELGD